MRVSAVVVNHQARDLLLACVDSALRALADVEGGGEVIIADSGSDDGGPDAVRIAHPGVRVVDLGANLGFGAAANAGARTAGGEWVLVLNNDVTLESDALAEMLRAVAGRPEVGAVAPLLRFARGGTVNSAGIGMDRLGVAFDRDIGRPVPACAAAPVPVFGASGGAALLRRAMLDDLGGFDESLFLYLEDVDLAWRAQMRGWRTLHVPTAVVHHHHSATSGHNSPLKHYCVGRNRVRLLARHMPLGDLLLRGPAIAGYELAYVAYAVAHDRTWAPVRGRWHGLREWRAERARGAGRRPVALAPARGLGAALRRRRAAAAGTARPTVRSRRSVRWA